MLSTYYNASDVEDGVHAGLHRDIVGGLWEELGTLQLQFLIAQGMGPESTVLDIGCGSLRFGVKAAAYLQPGRYFGTDLNASLIEAGYKREFDDALRARVPRENLVVNEDFDFDFLRQPVDFAVAQSVFTHLPLNHLRRCLALLAPVMQSGGQFLVTYFECGQDQDLYSPLVHGPAGVISRDCHDPYHYRVSDLSWAARADDWLVEPIGDWGHPRGQKILRYRKT